VSLCRVQAAGRSFLAAPGTPLHVALAQAGVGVETPCGARGYCRKCAVKVLTTPPPPTPADLEQLAPQELEQGFRLSCQIRLTTNIAVALVPAALTDTVKARLGRISGPIATDPWAELPATGRALGLAVDVGTTSVVAALLDLRSGEELTGAATPNPQAVHGADLMSRLTYATAGPGNPRELQALVAGAIDRLVEQLCQRSGADPADIRAAAVCGNTCMHHLLLGLPVESLAVAPYTPVVTAGTERSAAEIGWRMLRPETVVYALPNVAGFVGADAVAAAVAAGLDQPGPPLALVDIGTNGEVVLRSGEEVFAASAPAGPAFEGGEISQGMRAAPGAIQGVLWDGADLALDVVRGAAARGICGSGLLDAVAALHAAGLLDYTGRIQQAGPQAGRAAENRQSISLAPGVALTQRDVRQLQLAKGAIRTGIDMVLRKAGVRTEELEALLLAGSFGNYLRRESALAIGLLPPLTADRVRPVGNAAAVGAKLALLTKEGRRRCEALAARIRHIDLARHPDFEAAFIANLNLPQL